MRGVLSDETGSGLANGQGDETVANGRCDETGDIGLANVMRREQVYAWCSEG